MKMEHSFFALFMCFAPVCLADLSVAVPDLSGPFEDLSLLNLDSVPVEQITNGTYASSSGYFGLMRVEAWADEYRVATCSNYGSNCVTTNFNLTRVSGNTFSGKGQLEARYDDVTCFYPVRVTVKAYSDRLFVRSIHPDALYDSIVNRVCPYVSSTEMVHDRPYVIRN